MKAGIKSLGRIVADDTDIFSKLFDMLSPYVLNDEGTIDMINQINQINRLLSIC